MGYLYLGLTLLAWTTLAFCYRWGESRKADRLLTSVMIGVSGCFWALLSVVLLRLDVREADPSQLIIGGVMGVGGVAAIPLFMAAVARGDLSITWTVLTLSFAPAALLSMIYPGEEVLATGVLGLVAAAAAVILLGADMVKRHRSDSVGKPRRGWFLFMSLSFTTNLGALYGYRLAAHFLPDKTAVHKAGFFLSMYAAWAIVGVVVWLARPKVGSKKPGLIAGSAVGSLLVGGGCLSLLALNLADVPGHVLYPATSGGSSILVFVLSVIFLKERPGRFGWIGMIAGAGALTLLAFAA